MVVVGLVSLYPHILVLRHCTGEGSVYLNLKYYIELA
jgi:hypothetical protein